MCYVEWSKSGKRTWVASTIVRKYAPQAIIRFYESKIKMALLNKQEMTNRLAKKELQKHQRKQRKSEERQGQQQENFLTSPVFSFSPITKTFGQKGRRQYMQV